MAASSTDVGGVVFEQDSHKDASSLPLQQSAERLLASTGKRNGESSQPHNKRLSPLQNSSNKLSLAERRGGSPLLTSLPPVEPAGQTSGPRTVPASLPTFKIIGETLAQGNTSISPRSSDQLLTPTAPFDSPALGDRFRKAYFDTNLAPPEPTYSRPGSPGRSQPQIDWVRSPICEHCGSMAPRQGATTVYGSPVPEARGFLTLAGQTGISGNTIAGTTKSIVSRHNMTFGCG